MIQVRQAVYEDIPRIMKFIDEHWKKGHVMGNDRTMFEFQHVRGKEVFYILAEDDVDGKIYGAMGYIPMMELEWACMSCSMIRSLENPENRMLGEEMARYFEKNMRCFNQISVGINKRYARVISKMGDNIGKLNHYYLLGNQKEYKIARITNVRIPHVKKEGAHLIPLETIEDFCREMDLEVLAQDYPKRTPYYIGHRYYDHPYFKYNVWGIQRNGDVKAAFVTRDEHLNGAKALRIVDFFGRDEEFAYVGKALQALLREEEYEYVDFYCYGIQDSILRDAGFCLRDEKDENIIPNYFAPFEQKNIDIYFYVWYKEKIHVYRGFGDQDRPGSMAQIQALQKMQ